MPKKIKDEVVDETVDNVEAPVVEEVVEVGKKTAKKIEWPVVVGNGKFQAIKHGDGWVLYNPDGTRVSGLETESSARDLALKMNNSAGLK